MHDYIYGLATRKTTAQQITDFFSGGAEGFRQAGERQRYEWAKRIVDGENPDLVLQGLKQDGFIYTDVMNYHNHRRIK